MSVSRILCSLWVPLCALLAGCTDNKPSQYFSDYLSKIASVQEATPLKSDLPKYEDLPRKRELYIPIDPISIGLLESYQLRKCGLFNLIAEKNSALGKVADEFRNYNYQRDVLYGISRCIEEGNIDDTLKQKLIIAEKQKRPELYQHQWNLTYTSHAMQEQLKGRHWLEQGLAEQVTQVNHAISILNQAFEGSNIDITSAQEVIEKQHIIGNLSYSLFHAYQHLDIVTKQLLDNDDKILCGQNINNTKFRYLNNVFEQQYLGKVQPYMATLDSYYQQLSANLILIQPKPEMSNFKYPLVEIHEKFRSSIQEHVSYWQRLFQRCGKTVG